MKNDLSSGFGQLWARRRGPRPEMIPAEQIQSQSVSNGVKYTVLKPMINDEESDGSE